MAEQSWYIWEEKRKKDLIFLSIKILHINIYVYIVFGKYMHEAASSRALVPILLMLARCNVYASVILLVSRCAVCSSGWRCSSSILEDIGSQRMQGMVVQIKSIQGTYRNGTLDSIPIAI
jgi:hypothetical protein